MSLPPWVVDRLVAAGHMSLRGSTRQARARRCKCGAGVVSGLDGRVMALDTDADPVALSEVGVLAARLVRRRVLGLSFGLGRPELFASSAVSAPWGCVMVVEHVCGLRVPSEWRAPRVDPPAPSSRRDGFPF